MADILEIPLELVQDTSYKLSDILHPVSHIHVAMSINKGRTNSIFNPCTEVCREHRYQVHLWDLSILTHPTQRFLVVTVINEKTRVLGPARSILKDKVLKRLDLFGGKNYSLVSC